MKESLGKMERLIPDPKNLKPSDWHSAEEWVNEKYIENPSYNTLWSQYQQKRREVSQRREVSDTPSVFEQPIGGLGFDVQTFKGGMHFTNVKLMV